MKYKPTAIFTDPEVEIKVFSVGEEVFSGTEILAREYAKRNWFTPDNARMVKKDGVVKIIIKRTFAMGVRK